MTVIAEEEEEEEEGGGQVLWLTEENSFDLDSEFTFRKKTQCKAKKCKSV